MENTEKNPLSTNESIKATSNLLRGNLATELQDISTNGISEVSNQLSKFHGLYMQDDRDKRNLLKKEKKEKAFAFMLRVRLPGGRATVKQWLILDEIADHIASPSLRLTTRQTFQFHGILKGNVKKAIREMNTVLLDSIAACGDVNRNVMAPPNPERDPIHQIVYEHALEWSQYALPRSRAYFEIYLDEKLVSGGEEELEPMYGETYLPRKFKTGFAIPPSNDVDIYSQDLGFVAIVENNRLLGYTVLIGGGLGMSHGNLETFPRLATPLGFIKPDQVCSIGEAILTTQRDYGNRVNRKIARLKYTLEKYGIDWFRSEVEKCSGIILEEARPFEMTSIADPTGWNRCADGNWFYGLHILSGRIRDSEGWHMKSALREIARIHKGDFRLTPSQNLTISGVSDQQKDSIDRLLEFYHLDKENDRSALRLNSLSCVALPTCGLALAESERILPDLIKKFEIILEEVGLSRFAISLRVTGCPNGCARPYLAEIGLVGKAPGKYALYLGAKYNGTRLNRLFATSVTLDQAIEILKPIIQQYAKERNTNEEFGDFCNRVILPKNASFHALG